MNAPPMDVISLELTIFCPRQLRPQKWKFKTGESSKAILPFNPSSIVQLKGSDKPIQSSPIPENQLKIQRKRRMLSGYHYSMPQIRKKMENRGTWRYEYLASPSWLNAILRGAKNLRSLIFDPVDQNSKLKSMRKARGLQYVHLKLDTSKICGYPCVFKPLKALEKIKLEIKWLNNEKSETLMVNKFFGFVWSLPKLKHLAVWLNEGGDYYKTLLAGIHAKKLSSFHIVVFNNTFEPASLPKSEINWGGYIDALYIGPIYSLEDTREVKKWSPVKSAEKRLRLKREENLDDLVCENTTIRNLEIVDFFSIPSSCLGKDQAQNLIELISQMKGLENLVLDFGETEAISAANYDDFNKELSMIESLGNLRSLVFSLAHAKQVTQKILPPFGNKMKNLKMLSLNIVGAAFDFSDWIEVFKELSRLGEFCSNYKDYFKNYLKRWHRSLEGSFPFEQLKNLKSISLYCNIPFSENSIEQLVKSILEGKRLKSLKIDGEIFEGLDEKKVSRLVEELCLKKKLEFGSFHWKEIGVPLWIKVTMRRVNGKMTVSSERKRDRC